MHACEANAIKDSNSNCRGKPERSSFGPCLWSQKRPQKWAWKRRRFATRLLEFAAFPQKMKHASPAPAPKHPRMPADAVEAHRAEIVFGVLFFGPRKDTIL